jgi:hypothetical protein
MQINNEIIQKLKDFEISVDDGLAFLLCVYHKLTPSVFSEKLTTKIYTTGILTVLKEEKSQAYSVVWNISLFSDNDNFGNFNWVVTDYMSLFIEANPKKRGNQKSTVNNMKRFFSENPHIRKEEVIEATKMYIHNTDSTYIREPQYFIRKGAGSSAIKDLEDWIEKYKISLLEESGRNSVFNTMK